MKHPVMEAGGTADTETGIFLIMNRSRCPLFVCNYKSINIGIFKSFAVFLYIPL